MMRNLILSAVALLSLTVQPCYAEDIPSTAWEWVWFNNTKLNSSVQYRGFYENKIDYRNEFVYTYQDPEEVNGKTYLVMYDMILDSTTGFYVYMIHLRQEGISGDGSGDHFSWIIF